MSPLKEVFRGVPIRRDRPAVHFHVWWGVRLARRENEMSPKTQIVGVFERWQEQIDGVLTPILQPGGSKKGHAPLLVDQGSINPAFPLPTIYRCSMAYWLGLLDGPDGLPFHAAGFP